MTSIGPSDGVPLDGAYRLTAFGLNVDCDWPLPGSAQAPAQLPRDVPSTVVRRLPADEIDSAWVQPGEPVLSPPAGGGEASYSAERTPQHYRFDIEGFGRYVVGIDGTSIVCELGGAPRDQQERFVFAHALPVTPQHFMYVAGIIEIVAGLAMLLSPWTKVFSYVIAAWLAAIALNLIGGGFYDIAVRDLVMAVSAVSLARLTDVVHVTAGARRLETSYAST